MISGRHRLDLARRSGERTIPAQVHDESRGFDASRAAILDAELNIRDGQGKVGDYVKFFKESGLGKEESESKGLLARATGKRAYTLATGGSDELIAAHNNAAISDQAAYEIALNAPNEARLQAVAINALTSGKNLVQAINTMHAVKALANERGDTTGDMFGFDDSAMREAEAMAKIAARRQREAGETLAAISGANKRPDVAAREGVNIHDRDSLAGRVETLRQQKADWDNWSSRPDLIAEIRQEMGDGMNAPIPAIAKLPDNSGVIIGKDQPAPIPENSTGNYRENLEPAREPPEPALTPYTEADLASRAREQQDAQTRETTRQQEIDDRAVADEQREGFDLTGSDRDADIAVAAGQGRMFSRSDNTRQAYEARIDELFSGKPAKFAGARVLDSSDVLDLLDYDGKPVLLNEGKVVDGQYNHGLTAAHWKKIPDWLDSPAAVFDSDSVKGRVVFVAPETVGNYPVFIIVDPAGANSKAHLLVNAYDKTSGKAPFGRWVSEGKLRFVNQKVSPAVLARSGFQLPSLAQVAQGYGRKIYTERDLVKYRAERDGRNSRADFPDNSGGIYGKKSAAVIESPSEQSNAANMAKVRGFVAEITQNWANSPEIEVVHRPQDAGLPSDVDAAWIPDGQGGAKVVLVASKLADKPTVFRKILHEVITHNGLRGVMNEATLNRFLDDVYRAHGGKPEFARIVAKYRGEIARKGGMGSDSGKRLAAEEYVARLAESNPKNSFIDRLVVMLAGTLRKIFPDIKLTRPEVVDMIAKARDWTARGETAASRRIGRGQEQSDGMNGSIHATAMASRDAAQKPDYQDGVWTDGTGDIVAGDKARADRDERKANREYYSKSAPSKEELARQQRKAATLTEARQAANAFLRQPIENADTGLVAYVSRNSLDKMLSASAVAKSINPQAHILAVANVDHLFKMARRGETRQDRDADANIGSIQRYYAPLVVNGRAVKAKLTIKEMANPDQNNTIYSVETLEIVPPERIAPQSGIEWVNDTRGSASTPQSGGMESIGAWLQSFNTDHRFSREDAATGAPDVKRGTAAKAHSEPITREQVLRPLLKALNVPLYQGRVKGGNRLGFYVPKARAVRIKNKSDLEVAAHELAHLVDDNIFNGFGKNKGKPQLRPWMRGKNAKIYAKELAGVSYDAKKVYEGWAEFVRLWMTQPDAAAAQAPELFWLVITSRDRHNRPSP